MEQIDVMKYEEDLKKDRFKRMLHNKQALFTAFVADSNIPLALTSESDVFRALSTFVIGFEIAHLKRYWNKENLFEEKQISNMLRTTITYQELDNEYKLFIKDVAELIRYVGLKSSKEVVMYLQALMELGYFSKGLKHQYKKFSHEKDYLIEMCGAKIVSGTSVCRHMSAFFVDVINELGYTAASVPVSVTSDDPVHQIRRKNSTPDHAVAGFTEYGEKLMFDPTHGLYIALPQDIDFSATESSFVGQYVIPKEKKYSIISPTLIDTLNLGREQQCQVINSTKLATLTTGEVEYIKNKIEQVAKGNMYNQFDFYRSHEKQRQRIESLYQELLPYSDTPITKHLVRK